jgi:endonuclease/exonuclease/phosphatase family metal-dependent hydrolase
MDGKRDLARINALMDEHKIDIAVFQEMETRSSRGGAEKDIAVLAGLSRPHHLAGPNIKHGDGWYGNLLVSRYPVMASWTHNLETVSYLEPRNAVDALIDTPLGKIRVIGTHLSLSPFERRSEGRNLLRLISEVEEDEKNPILLMGDLNEWRAGAKLFQHMKTMLNPVPFGATFPSFGPLFKLDQVWHDGQMDISAKVLLDPPVRILSDHLPVVVEVSRMVAEP